MLESGQELFNRSLNVALTLMSSRIKWDKYNYEALLLNLAGNGFQFGYNENDLKVLWEECITKAKELCKEHSPEFEIPE